MESMLYLCATPIGNLGDITKRAVEALEQADAVYAEDTRHSGLLLANLGIKKPMVSCHQHNEAQRAEEIVNRVKNGESIVYVSDAGMPGISDPGTRLVQAAIEAEIPYTVLPGACAAACALVLSGLSSDAFCFLGFLPRENKPKKALLAAYATCPATLILYESPHRVADTFALLVKTWGERSAALVREISKLHETVHRGTLSSLAAEFTQTPPRGECVLVVAGAEAQQASEDDVASAIKRALAEGLSAAEAAKRAAKETGTARNAAYQIALSFTKQD